METVVSNIIFYRDNLIADIYIFDKYGNFWTSKYILEVTMATNLIDTDFKHRPREWIVLARIDSIFWEVLF